DPKNTIPVEKRPRFDRWIMSELQELIQKVDANYENYEPTQAARAIQDFVNDQLSNWYIRLSRKRFWMSEMNEDKQAAYETLYECLFAVSQLMSPIAPFYADWLYQNLVQPMNDKSMPESVHLTDFRSADISLIDRSLSDSMHIAQSISSLVHSLRKKEKIKVRQPLQKILVPVLSEKEKQTILDVEALIKTEINVKDIELIDDTSGILVKKIKPNFRKLGQTYGPKMKSLTPLINGLDQDAIRDFEQKGTYTLPLDGEDITLSLEEVEITSEDIPGWLVASEGGLTVALDITLTDDLKKEGISRDIVNRVQNLRKDQGMEVQDKISIQYFSGDEITKQAIEKFKEYIQKETQALKLEYKNELSNGTELDIDGVPIRIAIDVLK
ncbi:MAG: DUF5915 domain-containing protein, partial [Cyclobacteriaceae bacterium]